MGCPDTEKVALYLDEQLSVSESKRFEAHLEGCALCREALGETRSLMALIEADPDFEKDDDAFLDGVMTAIDRPAARPRRLRIAVAAAAGFLLLVPLVVLQTGRSATENDFAARGEAGTALSSLVDVTPLIVSGDTIRPVADKGRLTSEDGIAFQYTNHFGRSVYFMAFAIDAREEVHWFYPAYLLAQEDPGAVVLSGKQRNRLMPDIVQAEGVPDGPMEIVVVLSRRRHTVKQVEKGILSLSGKPVDALFSIDDIIKRWTVTYHGER